MDNDVSYWSYLVPRNHGQWVSGRMTAMMKEPLGMDQLFLLNSDSVYRQEMQTEPPPDLKEQILLALPKHPQFDVWPNDEPSKL